MEITGGYAYSGGGISNSGTLTVADCTLTGNVAENDGGGIANHGVATITSSTLWDNSAGSYGGGAIANSASGQMTIVNSTLSGNRGTGLFARGGGIANEDTLDISSSTLTGNSASIGGGIWVSGDTSLKNTIIANNTAANWGPDILGGFDSQGHNLIGNSAASSGWVAGDLLDIDPLLGPLQDNGGLTRTHALLVGSSAIDAGDNLNAPATDQRGFVRMADADQDGTPTVDIGAYEGHMLVVNDTGDSDDGDLLNGVTTLREAVNVANQASDADAIWFDPSISGATITLAGTELEVEQDLLIFGPGPDALTISGNNASRVFYKYGRFTLEISGLTITEGAASSGGGIYSYLAGLRITNCTLAGNSATNAYGNGYGGAVFSGGPLAISDTTFSDNSATGDGGAITFTGGSGPLTVVNTTFSRNSAMDEGGAIAIHGAVDTKTILNTTFSDNSAKYGGAIYTSGAVEIATSTFSDNSANYYGGAIDNDGLLEVTDSTLSGNSADFVGGAIYNRGTFEAINCTLSGNWVAKGHGGAIANDGTLKITNSTIADNWADNSGGGIYDYGEATLKNTIVAGNSATDWGPDVDGEFTSQGHNLIADPASSTGWGESDLLNVDPQLGPLQDNGGPTFTHALLPGSPAIDAGDNTDVPAADQRGFARTTDGDGDGAAIVDIGAFEVQVFLVDKLGDVVDGDVSPGETTLREAVDAANAVGDTDTILFDPGLSGTTIVLAGSQLTISENVQIIGLGADTLTISGDHRSRVFEIPAGVNFRLAGVTVAAGSADYGAGIVNWGTLTVVDCMLTDNVAVGAGGGILNTGLATISGSTLRGNSAGKGGGIYNHATPGILSGSLTVGNTTFSGNSALRYGGIYNYRGVLTVNDSRFTGNPASEFNGEIVSASGGIIIANNTVFTGYTTWAIQQNFPSAMTITDCTFSDGYSGIEAAGTMEIINSTFTGHTGKVGAMRVWSGHATITGSTFSDNDFVGLQVRSGTATISNSTFSGNGSSGIVNDGSATIRNSTFSGNGSSGIANYGSATIRNTIIAGNSLAAGDPDVLGVFYSEGNNLVGNVGNSVGLTHGENGDQVGGGGNPVIDPLLGPLADNGGPTFTRALLPGSPAIDAGSNDGSPALDQRGLPRPVDGNGDGVAVTDIGAFEAYFFDYGDAPDPTYPTLVDIDGARHFLVDGLFLGAGADADGSGQPSPLADGDDNDQSDDEDGVQFVSVMSVGMAATVDVTASGEGLLSGWIDFNSDGDWDDADEQVFTDEPLVAGVNRLSLFVPVTAVLTDATFARFRFSTQAGLSYAGLAQDGEVEDYAVTIYPPPGVTITETDASTEVSEDGQNDSYDVVLDAPPMFDVTVTLSPDSQVAVDTSELTFTSTSWNVPQTVTVWAVDDPVFEWPHTGTITHAVTSDDSNYGGFAVDSVTASIEDNDTLVVTSTLDTINPSDDATAFTLREAILAANANPDLDAIVFAISPTDPGHVYYAEDGDGLNGAVDHANVTPTTAANDTDIGDIDGDWPHSWYSIQLTSPLPLITAPVIIDGYSQPGATRNTNPIDQAINAVLRIELEGSQLGFARGLEITADNSTVRGLVVNRFEKEIIAVENASGNHIEGNFIGTDVSGTLSPGFSVDLDVVFGSWPRGVSIYDRGGNWIGVDDSQGSAADHNGQRNLISGNLAGVVLNGPYSDGNVVAGNFIGTDRSGRAPLPNLGGIATQGDGAGDRIGTDGDGVADEAERNIISGNKYGMMLGAGAGAPRNALVAGNFIGTDIQGNAMGNASFGVMIFLGAHSNQIGGTDPALGNTIAFNGWLTGSQPAVHAGVWIDDLRANSYGNRIQGNSIHSNVGLGIDLDGDYPLPGGDGVTDNDPLDADGGPNNLQNYPIIALAEAGETTRVAGSLNSLADTTFTLDFYANSTLDPSGHGEGERWLGSTSVTTDAAGNASFHIVLSAETVSTEWITGTATEEPTGNTSEFSAAVLAYDIIWDGNSDGDGDGVNWTDPLNWSTDTLPGPEDNVLIDVDGLDIEVNIAGAVPAINSVYSTESLNILGGALGIAAKSEVKSLVLSGGRLYGAGDLHIQGAFTWTKGNMNGVSSTELAGTTYANGGLTITGDNDKYLQGRKLVIANDPTLDVDATLDAGTVFIRWYAEIENQGTFTIENDADLPNADGTAHFFNQGTLIKSTGTDVSYVQVGFHNSGIVEVEEGTLQFSRGYTQADGQTILNGGDIASSTRLDIQGGRLSGSGTVFGSVFNGAETTPGFSFGLISITGNYDQNSTGSLNVEIGELAAEIIYDQVAVEGTVTLNGGLNVILIDGFEPTAGDLFTIINNADNDLIDTTFRDLGEGDIMFVDHRPFQISYQGGDGNDVVLTALPVLIGSEGEDEFLVEQGSNVGEIKATLTNQQGTEELHVSAGQLFLFGLGGNDEVIITAALAEGVTVDLGEGDDDDDYTVYLGSLQGPVTIHDSGTSGTDRLNVMGTNDPDIINKTASQITWGAPVAESINYGDMEKLKVNGRGGRDHITDPGTNTTLLGGDGDDTIIVNGTFGGGVVVDGEEGADTVIIQLGELDGPVTVTDSGTTGTTTVRVVGTDADDQMTLSASQLTSADEVVNLDLASGDTDLILDGGAGHDLVTIDGTLPEGVTMQLLSLAQIVQVDIKPDSNTDIVNLLSKGVIPVVIFTTADFNASMVDVSTVQFLGATAAQSAMEDIDGDGDLDLVLHFRVQDTDLDAAYVDALLADLEDGQLDSEHQDILAVLSGLTSDGNRFEGTDILDAFLAGKALEQVLLSL